MRSSILVISFLALIILVFSSARPVEAIPALARKFGLQCATCHAHGAKLNPFGMAFAAGGPKAVGLEEKVKGPPLTAYISWLARQSSYNSEPVSWLSRFEWVFDEVTDKRAYFIEWRLLSYDINGNGFLDRSGRFEDVIASFVLTPGLALDIGQFRPLAQTDVSQRVSNSEALALTRLAPGDQASNARRTGLRGFAPAARSPGLRALFGKNDPNGWHGALTLPFPGEFSIPLTGPAQKNASFEFEPVPKGVLVEAWNRKEDDHVGAFGFIGNAGRSVVGATATKLDRNVFYSAAVTKLHGRLTDAWLASLEALYVPKWQNAYGFRLDLAQREPPIYVPFLSYHIPGDGNVFRFVLEGRFRSGSRPTIVFEINFLH
ncbi:MAG: hypothetical protein WAO58_04380 [Fimbriimonadaceae bacterium]